MAAEQLAVAAARRHDDATARALAALAELDQAGAALLSGRRAPRRRLTAMALHPARAARPHRAAARPASDGRRAAAPGRRARPRAVAAPAQRDAAGRQPPAARREPTAARRAGRALRPAARRRRTLGRRRDRSRDVAEDVLDLARQTVDRLGELADGLHRAVLAPAGHVRDCLARRRPGRRSPRPDTSRCRRSSRRARGHQTGGAFDIARQPRFDDHTR
jgi:hypothetical protein